MGALHRNQQTGVLMESNGEDWAPVISRHSGATNGSTGEINTPVAGWEERTHLQLRASVFRLWPAASVSFRRGWNIRSARSTGNMTIKVTSGESLNGVTDGTWELPPGQAVFVASDGAGEWTVY